MSEERTGPEPGEPDDLELDDEGEEADEGEELDVGEGDTTDLDVAVEQEHQTEQRLQSRAERRITRQQERLRALEEQNRRLTEALTRPPAQPQYQPPPVDQARLDREEFERVSQMPFEEQSRYWARKTEERVQQQINLHGLQTRDMLDQSNFRQIMREKRLPAKYANEVETLLSQARQQGMNPTREMVLQTVIGREVLDRKDRETDRARQRGQRRIASQTVRPGGRGSTAATAGGRREQDQEAADKALLMSITWGEANR